MDNIYWKPNTEENLDELEKELIVIDKEEDMRVSFVKMILDDGERRNSEKDPLHTMNLTKEVEPVKVKLEEEDFYDNIFWKPIVIDATLTEDLL